MANRVLTLLFVISFFNLCNSCSKKTDSVFVEPISLSTSLTDSTIKFENAISGNYNIIQFVNLDCSLCVSEVFDLDSLYILYNQKGIHISVILSGHNIEIFKYYIEQKQLNIPVFFDSKKEFFILNHLDNDKRRQALFLDRYTHIRARGSVIYSDEETQKFLTKINRIITKSKN
jgi:hypothetical protein